MPRRARSSFFFRAIVAVALLFGFYVLGLAVIAACLATIGLQVAAGHIFPKLVLLALVAAGAVGWGMLKSIFAGAAPFEPPGPEITAEDEPELFAVIRGVAARMNAKMPAHVYLMPDVNAFVAEVGGRFGFGSRRVMAIGVGLLQVNTVQQLKATIAHEFGHYAGGDTRLGGFLYRTRSSIVHTVQTLGRGFIASMFASYFRFYLRVTQRMSRAQELAADEWSVRVAGTQAHVTGLRREARAGAFFGIFVRNDLVPLANAGYKPKDFFAGFRRASKELASSGMKKKLDEALAKVATDAYDTHPALAERIEYAESLPVVEVESDDRLARALLKDASATEKRVGSELLGRIFKAPEKLEAIAWKEAGRVFGPQIEKEAERRRAQMAEAGYAASDALEAAETAVSALTQLAPAKWVAKIEPKIEEVPVGKQADAARSFIAHLAAISVGAALAARGAEWVADPGREVELREGETLHPIFAWANEAVADPKARQELLDRIRALRAPKASELSTHAVGE